MNGINWKISIGDPTFMGWLTVIAYLSTILLAFKIYFKAEQLFSPEFVAKQKIFWLVITLIMVFLGVNKQLDLQTLLTAIGKYYAHQQGWYQYRREIQFYLILGLIISLISMLIVFLKNMRGILMPNLLAISGLAILLIFIMIRATSFHHIDFIMNFTIFNIKSYRVLELLGITVIDVNALYLLRVTFPLRIS